ncbi:MAG: META domain-containing protein [Gammaproteobacteria bacterium]|nr:META domain-containing protein [Gammaproteobacteria bacterium]
MRLFSALLAGAILAMSTPLHSETIGAHGLRLPATFTGTLPCADCEGIAHHLDLWPNQSYHMRREWLGEDGENRRDEVGRWFADPARNAIVLHGASEMPLHWEVKGPDRLRQLDMEGNPIASALDYDVVSDGSLRETDLEGVFLGGMMTYMADAAIFQECMTGHIYPIAQEGTYLALERAYLADASGTGEPLYVHVEGGFSMRPAMEGPDKRSLVVERVIRTRPGITCDARQANAPLVNTYWRVESLIGDTVVGAPDKREPHIVLHSEGARLQATVGCNLMRGTYGHDGETLSFGPVASTMMACPPAIAEIERALSSVLSNTRTYRMSGDTLTLLDKGGGAIALLTAIAFR